MTLRYHIIFIISCYSYMVNAQENTAKYSLAQIVALLNEEYNVVFSYDASLILENKTKYNLPDEAVNLEIALREIFGNADISYRIVDEQKILIRKNLNLPEERSIQGVIIDQSCGVPLPFASVFVPGSTTGTITDINGEYSLSVNAATTIRVNYLGYQSQEYTLEELPEEIYLKPSPTIIEEVNIIIHPAIYNGQNNQSLAFDNHQMMKVAAVDVYGKDLIRFLQMLPGINAGTDQVGGLRIRGSQPDEVLIVIDGIPIYKVDHYYGIFGAINGDYINRTEVYKNLIPIQEDSRTAGMVVLSSQDRIKGTEGLVEGDFMKFNTYLESKLNNKVGLTMGGRFNHTDPYATFLATKNIQTDTEKALIDRQDLRRQKIEDVIPNFNFYDVNAKLKIDLSPKTSFSIAGIIIDDAYDRLYTDTVRHNINGVPVRSLDYLEEIEKWNTRGTSFQLSHIFTATKKLQSNLYYSSYRNFSAFENNIQTRNREKNFLSYKYLTETNNDIATLGASVQFISEHSFQIGVNMIHRNNDIAITEKGIKRINNQEPEKLDSRPLFRTQINNEISLYGEKELPLTKNLRLSGGLKINYLDRVEKFTLSPQARFEYRANEKLIWKASFARLYQNVRELNYENRFGVVHNYFVLTDDITMPNISTTRFFPQGISTNYMIGARLVWQDIMVDVEAYQKRLEGAIGFFPDIPGIGKQKNVPDRNSLFSIYTGETYTKGIDLLLSYNGPDYFTQLAYTYSKTNNRFLRLNNRNEYPAPNDRRHQLKWANSYQISHLTLGCNTIYTSGEPVLSFDKLRDQKDRREIDLSETFTNLPNYVRWDVSAEYKFHRRGKTPYLRASIYNLFDHKNVRSIQQTFALSSDANRQGDNIIVGFETPLIQRLYNISVGIEF